MSGNPAQKFPTRSFGLLVTGCVLLTCGGVLLLYAWGIRFTAIRFLEDGIETRATIHSIERRGARHGGRRIEVGFWDKSAGDSLLGDLKRSNLTDLVPLRHSGERPGDEIAIRWFEENGRLRIAPERSLHEATRPPEMRFVFGLGISAAGAILLGWYSMREARRRERPADPS